MSTKLVFFTKKSIAQNIHNYITQLVNTEHNDSSKSPIIGYKRKEFPYKFATLHGGRSYQSLILHVDPGNRSTTRGKDFQKRIQSELAFDIVAIRKHVIKSNEVYIPLEMLLNENSIDTIKQFILYAYHQDKLN